MPIGTGSRLGPYEVTGRLGAGGMGEVWRARHLSLKREAALKLLPDSFAADPQRLARFRREAEILASLNHANIAQVHGLEEGGGSTALVMELVEGETLADRIRRGPIPVERAVDVARQVAQALEAAHDQGVVHRDLKPANVKVRPDGTAKVLDFGLAKAVGSEEVEGGISPISPTLTAHPPTTRDGAVLGTTPYMSPEQTRGERVDARTDVWAFGCLLYEMLAGRRAFDGPTASDVTVAVLAGAPDWSRLPPGLPPSLRTLLRRCLARDLRQRVRHMSAALLVLEEQDALPDRTGASAGGAKGSRGRRAKGLLASSFVAGAAIAAGLAGWVRRPAPAPVVRTAIPADTLLAGFERNFAFTRDGSAIVYISGDSSQILVRRMDTLEPTPVLTTVSYIRGALPSPDGAWIGFIENSFTLRKVSAAGGPPVTVLQMDGPSRGAAWGEDDTIVFATASPTGLQQVAASGGPVTILTRPDPGRGEADHHHPQWLPGGRGVLFTIAPVGGDRDASKLAVLDMKTKTWRTVVEGADRGYFVDGGYLLYSATGAIWAVRFDLSQLKARGRPVEVLRPETYYDVSSAGTLAYARDVPTDYDGVVPVWVDRTGRETPLEVSPSAYRHPRLSPEGRRLAIVPSGEIFVWEMDRPWSTASRLTFDPGIDWYPVWAPDGGRIFYGSWRGGGFSNIYAQAPERAEATRLTDSPDMQLPTSISPDGSTLVFHSYLERIEALRVDGRGGSGPTTLVETPQEERNAVVSPDGRWLAYEAESPARAGRLDVFVRPFPDVERGLWQVTTGGGIYPTWCLRCPELFYQKPDGTLVAVPVEATRDTWRAGAAVDLFRGPYLLRGDGSLAREYDVTADGSRFLMLKPVRDAARPSAIRDRPALVGRAGAVALARVSGKAETRCGGCPRAPRRPESPEWSGLFWQHGWWRLPDLRQPRRNPPTRHSSL